MAEPIIVTEEGTVREDLTSRPLRGIPVSTPAPINSLPEGGGFPVPHNTSEAQGVQTGNSRVPQAERY